MITLNETNFITFKVTGSIFHLLNLLVYHPTQGHIDSVYSASSLCVAKKFWVPFRVRSSSHKFKVNKFSNFSFQDELSTFFDRALKASYLS